MLLLVSTASGAAVTHLVTGVTNGAATFHGSGTGSDGWFEWGAFSGGYYKWTTPNQSYSGTFSETQLGAPMMTGQTYYVRACDETGCGNEVTWTVPASTLPNRTSYGTQFIRMLRSGFNMSVVVPAIVAPYTLSMPGGFSSAAVVWGVLFFFIFAGYWLRPRDIFLPCVLAMFAGGAIWLGNTALGVPPEFTSIGQGLLYAAIAGIAVSWFSK